MPLIALNEIEKVTTSALERHGALPWIAADVAKAVRKAEAVGNRICGLYYLESYCKQLTSGRVNGTVEPTVSRPRSGTILVDAGFGFAQPAFARGLPDAAAAARECGVASLAICHAHTCTSLGYFTEQIAKQGLIGLGLTNASPIVAPPGGKTRVIGTNPIAFAVPDGGGGVAMQFDQSTTTVALGKITMAKAAGERIPEGWAVDADGNPTTDPEAALGGSLVSVGGYKGWGFGLMAEILAAGMTGGTVSRNVKPLKAPEGAPHDLGQYYLLTDPAVSPEFLDRLQQVSDEFVHLPLDPRRLVGDPLEVDPPRVGLLEPRDRLFHLAPEGEDVPPFAERDGEDQPLLARHVDHRLGRGDVAAPDRREIAQVDQIAPSGEADNRLADRVEILPGDFFNAVSGEADCIVMRHVLHDWNDDQSATILHNSRAALAEGGRLLIVEKVIQPGNEPGFAKLLDLNMLAIGGKERTEEQYRKLLQAAGLELVAVRTTPGPIDVVEARG